jgi:hypothetical protein
MFQGLLRHACREQSSEVNIWIRGRENNRKIVKFRTRRFIMNLILKGPTNGVSALSSWWGLSAPETPRAMLAVA